MLVRPVEMEGKSVILSVLILSLVMAQLQVDAKVCCPSPSARNMYKRCRMTPPACAKKSGCIIIPGNRCPRGFDYLTEEHSGPTEYCKLGCVSSVCNVLSALEESDESDMVNGAVAQCTNSCSVFCAKGSTDALEISSSK